MLQPRLKMPLWAAVAIPAAAYLLRSVARGTLRPELPADAIAFGALVVIVLLAAMMGSSTRSGDRDASEELHHEHGDEGGAG